MFLEEFYSSLTLPQAVASSLVCASVVAIALPWLGYKTWSSASSTNHKTDNIPWAPGAVPLLGHALSYKADPGGFLRASCTAVGSSIFRINLAGQVMVVVTDRVTAAIVARQPDAILSLRQAVEDYGFCETLGVDNVYRGTEFHKRIIRHDLVPHGMGAWMQSVRVSMERALEQELNIINSNNSNVTTTTKTRIDIPDFFEFTRRILTRVVLQSMVLGHYDDDDHHHTSISAKLVDQVLDWQNRVEDATAATAVLPTWLAQWTVLTPTRRRRLALQQELEALLSEQQQQSNNKDDTGGPWLRAFSRDGDKLSLSLQAEYILGLLFAGAKNPSLGAAQTMCFLLQHADWRDKVRMESAAWLQATQQSQSDDADLVSTCPTSVACIREATRLTALVIGSIRKVQKPVELQTTSSANGLKLTLKPGETVALSLLLPNTDPNEWPNATEFRPDRFLGKDASTTLPPLLTFSQGTHHCPGERLAVVLMHTYVSLLLCKYDLQQSGPIPDLSWERATIAQRKGPVAVSVQWKTKQQESK